MNQTRHEKEKLIQDQLLLKQKFSSLQEENFKLKQRS